MANVSVIIPLHNGAEYLAECLASVERQTLPDIEVVCVDDASTDASADIYRLFAEGNSRFRLLSFPDNRGVSAARNAGMAAATGEYLAFLDDDDWYPEDSTLEKLYVAAAAAGAPIAGGSFSEYDNRTGAIRDDYTGEGHLACFTFASEGRMDYRDWQGDFGFQRFIFKRDLIRDASLEFPPLIRHEDPVFLVKAMLAAGWFYAIPDVVYRYRFHHKPRMLGDESVDDAFEAIAEILVLARENGLETLHAWQVELLKVYAADSIGLILNEKSLLQLRARALRTVISSKAFQHTADIIGSYRSFAGEVIRQHQTG